MAWAIEFTDLALRQLEKLDRPVARRIYQLLYRRVAQLRDPRSIGAALRGDRFGSLWRYRVGNWRVICQIRDAEIVVLVVSVGPRSEVYR